MRRFLIAIAAVVCLSALGWGRVRQSGWCEQGAQTVTINAQSATPKFQRGYASATVSVFDTGTTNLSTIYSDNIGTAKANPFTADSTGAWFFYADNSRYDVQCVSGGTTLTYGDFSLLDPATFLSGNQTVGGVWTFSGNNIFNGANTFSAANTFSGSNAFSGTNIHSGLDNFKNLEAIRFADQFTGANCGAKINAADADLGATPGEIWVNQACGTTWSTAVTLSTGHTLRLAQCGTYTTSALITLGQAAGIVGGSPAGMGIGSSNPPCVIKAANSAALPAIITMTGPYSFLQDVVVDGNKTSAGTLTGATNGNITITTNGRAELNRVTTQNGVANGLVINASSGGKITKLMAIANTLDGIACVNSADTFILQSEIEDNVQHGIDLNECSAIRVENSDIGGNGSGGGKGVNIHGTAALLASENIFVGDQLGNNYQEDISVTGYNAGYSAPKQVITDNVFLGSPNRVANTYCDVAIVDGYANAIVGNIFESNTTKCGVTFTETAGGRATASTVVGNTFVTGFGTANWIDTVTNTELFAANSEGTTGLAMLANAYLPNNTALKFQTAGGGTDKLIGSDNANSVYIYGDSTQKIINFQTVPGVTQPLVLNNSTATFAGQIVSSLSTGTAPLSITSTTPVANLTVSNHPKVQFCGNTTTCSATAQTGDQIVYGSASLSSGTPSTATVTGISPAFTSSSSYKCSATNETTQTSSLKITYVSGSSFTITGPNTVTDNFSFVCVGN